MHINPVPIISLVFDFFCTGFFHYWFTDSFIFWISTTYPFLLHISGNYFVCIC